MAIDNTDKLIAAQASAQQIAWLLPTFTTAAARQSLHNRGVASNFGQFSGGGAFGSGGSIPVDSDPGFPTLTNAGAGKDNHLVSLGVHSTVAQAYRLMDVVYAVSGFSGVVTAPQVVVSPPALTRGGVNGVGNAIYVLGITALGTTASNLTVTYTNQDGVTGRTTAPLAMASFPAARIEALTLQAGDTGVRAIESPQLSASTGTAGNFAILIGKPLTPIRGVAANATDNPNWSDITLPLIEPDAAIGLVESNPAGTAAPALTVTLGIGAA